MIGKLQGVIDYVNDDFVILMAGHIGYKVFTPECLKLKDNTTLWIETVVREDSIKLFGFSSLNTQNLFNLLTTVSGVGPKVALTILKTLKPDNLITAIAQADSKTIATAPGVGKKVAEKIIVELKGKTIPNSSLFNKSENSAILDDLLLALESLGYKRLDVLNIAQQTISTKPNSNLQTLIPLALKEISERK